MLRALVFFLIFCAVPAFAAHTGEVTRRSMPEPSDLALAAMAAFGVWLAQRALRRRARRARKD
jgi:hypothetical protein